MKVKIVSAASAGYWYNKHIGEIFDVYDKPAKNGDFIMVHEDYTGYTLLPDDCEIVNVVQLLQEQLQAAKDNVASLEKLLAEEAEREATRPFTQEEYEAVVAKYRACKGRKKFVAYKDNYGVEISTLTDVCYDNYSVWSSFALFGVWFSSEEYVQTAIEEIGEDNLKRAWEFEMSIGL